MPWIVLVRIKVALHLSIVFWISRLELLFDSGNLRLTCQSKRFEYIDTCPCEAQSEPNLGSGYKS